MTSIFSQIFIYFLGLSRAEVLNYRVCKNIDNMFFKEDAHLKDEFKYIFSSIFKNPDDYMKIISVLVRKKIGLTRNEIIENAKIINSGALSTKLDELESCGFIRKYNCFGMKSKGTLYQIIDNFTIFYYSFTPKNSNDENFFSNQISDVKKYQNTMRIFIKLILFSLICRYWSI